MCLCWSECCVAQSSAIVAAAAAGVVRALPSSERSFTEISTSCLHGDEHILKTLHSKCFQNFWESGTCKPAFSRHLFVAKTFPKTHILRSKRLGVGRDTWDK